MGNFCDGLNVYASDLQDLSINLWQESQFMTNEKTPERKQDTTTEADAKSVDGHSGQSNKSSHDAKSHTKANTNEGAGGGKKQERHH
jgi:hypothetical protein